MEDGVTDEEGKLVCFQDEPTDTWYFNIDVKIVSDLARIYLYDKKGRKINALISDIHPNGRVCLKLLRSCAGTAIFLTKTFVEREIVKEMIEVIEDARGYIQPSY